MSHREQDVLFLIDADNLKYNEKQAIVMQIQPLTFFTHSQSWHVEFFCDQRKVAICLNNPFALYLFNLSIRCDEKSME